MSGGATPRRTGGKLFDGQGPKSYREKKAKPLLAKIVQVLRSMYRAYIELKGKLDRLQGDYNRVREGNARLSDKLMEVKMENKKLRQIFADYERSSGSLARSVLLRP